MVYLPYELTGPVGLPVPPGLRDDALREALRNDAVPVVRQRAEAERFAQIVAESLEDLRDVLAGAAQSRRAHYDEASLRGLERFSDDELLRLADGAATGSEINQEWIDAFQAAVDVLDQFKEAGVAWSDENDCLLLRIRSALEDLEWARSLAWEWSKAAGREYDRRHPDRTRPPFEPMDLGPGNSARLPKVL